MDHQQRTFQFADKEGKLHEFKTKKYNFNLEQILINRFGKEAWFEFRKSHSLNYDITIQNVKEDFPKLFENLPDDFDWGEPDYDTILEVYFFLSTYKDNALLRQVQLEKEMLALLNQALEDNLSFAQKTLLKSQSSTNTPSIS